jgi:hypothetical protein
MREPFIQKFDEFVQFACRHGTDIHLLAPALCQSIQQSGVALDVIAEWSARLLANQRGIAPDEGVQHHRNSARALPSVPGSRIAVQRDLLR